MIGSIASYGILGVGMIVLFWQNGSLRDDLAASEANVEKAVEINSELKSEVNRLGDHYERLISDAKELQIEVQGIQATGEANRNNLNSLRGKANEKLDNKPGVVARAASVGTLRWMRAIHEAARGQQGSP